MPPNRNAYIRQSLGDCLAAVHGIRFTEGTNAADEYPRGAYRCGSSHFSASDSGDNRSETGATTALVRVEVRVPDDASIDDALGAAEAEVERAIILYDPPPPLEHPYYTVIHGGIERTDVVPSVVRDKGTGTLLIPVIIKFTQHWT
jgi:hypothetical protein